MKVLWISLFLLLSCGVCTACPACYGAQDSPMTAGMNAAILVMLGIIGGVLSLLVTIGVYLWRRGRRQSAADASGSYVDNNGVLKLNDKQGVVEWNNT